MTQKRIREILEKQNLDAILISDGNNIRYLSGFEGATGYLYLSKNAQMLLTDSRYTTAARKEATGFEVKEVSALYNYEKALKELVQKDGIQALGFEDHDMTYRQVKRMQEEMMHIEWVPLTGEIERLRMIKNHEELKWLEKAEAIGDLAFEKILKEIKPGMTELQVAAKLDYFMKEAGAQRNSFETIAASGIHSSMPHAIPSEKKLESGDFLTMDFGCCYNGYCSDMTRTVVIGKASDKQKEIYKVVLDAQKAALKAVRAGLTGAEIDGEARNVIEEAGYGKYFGHGLGHGVGLFIHEEPRLSPGCHETLQENMIQTVEPGIYIPEFGGVRIEDMVVITKEGHRNLTHSPKELIEL